MSVMPLTRSLGDHGRAVITKHAMKRRTRHLHHPVRALALLAGLLCSGLAPADAREQAAGRCQLTLQDLGTLGGPSSQAMALGADGSVVGQAQAPDGSLRAFLAAPGQALQDLSERLPDPGLSSRATAIDAQGRVAGVSGPGAWLLSPGQPLARQTMPPVLGSPCSHEFYAQSVDRIASDGALVGRLSPCLSNSQALFVVQPPAADGSTAITPLGTQTSELGGQAPAINRWGDLAFSPYQVRFGNCRSARGQQRLPSGDYAPWSTLAVGDELRPCARAEAITERGWVLGTRYFADALGAFAAQRHQAYAHDPVRGRTLPLASPLSPDGASWAHGSSPDGRLVAGAAAAGSGPDAPAQAQASLYRWDTSRRAFVGRMLPVGGGADGRPTEAVAVTSQGQVLGRALLSSSGTTSNYHHFVQQGRLPAQWLHQLFPVLGPQQQVFQNERGQLAGSALVNGLTRAFRISCEATAP